MPVRKYILSRKATVRTDAPHSALAFPLAAITSTRGQRSLTRLGIESELKP
jgi:hypothetical protein